VRLLWDKKGVFTWPEASSSTERDGNDKNGYTAAYRQTGGHNSPLELEALLLKSCKRVKNLKLIMSP